MLILILYFALGFSSLGFCQETVSPQRAPGAMGVNTETDAWTTFKSNSEASYYVSLAGQSLGERQWGASYNPFTGSKWPMQFFSALYYGYRFTPQWTVGLELSGVWNFASGISNHIGEISTGAALFQPAIQLKRANVIDTSWLNVNGTIQIILPTSDYERQNKTLLLSAALDNTWSLKLPSRRWSLGINTRVQTYVYERAMPEGLWDTPRQTLYLAAGHFLGYNFSDHFALTTSTQFDAVHWAGSPSFFDFAPSNDDFWKLQFNWYPGFPVFKQLGIFTQGLIFNPMLATTIVGMDMTLRL